MVERMTMDQARAELAKVTKTHADVKAEVRQYLEVTGWYVFGVLQNGKGIRASVHKGISDLICIKDGLVAFVEIKVGRDKLRPDQEKFRDRITAHGGLYVEARSIDDVTKLGGAT